MPLCRAMIRRLTAPDEKKRNATHPASRPQLALRKLSPPLACASALMMSAMWKVKSMSQQLSWLILFSDLWCVVSAHLQLASRSTAQGRARHL
jgi:hypothetical protein